MLYVKLYFIDKGKGWEERERERERLTACYHSLSDVFQDERKIRTTPMSEIFWFDLDRGYPLIEVFLEFKGRTESYKIKTVSH